MPQHNRIKERRVCFANLAEFKRYLVEARAEATVAAAKLAQWEDQRWWRDRERQEMRKRKARRGSFSPSFFASAVPDGIAAAVAARTTKESMLSLSAKAKKVAAAREAPRSAAVAAGGRETVVSAAEHELSFEGGVDDARAEFEGAGLVWAYSDVRRVAVVIDGGTEGGGGAFFTSRFRRRVATVSVK